MAGAVENWLRACRAVRTRSRTSYRNEVVLEDSLERGFTEHEGSEFSVAPWVLPTNLSVGGGAMRRAAMHRVYGLLDRHSLVHFVQIIAGVGALTRAGTST